MRRILFALIFTNLAFLSLAQSLETQKIKLSKKDSIRLKNIPELQVPPGYLQNKSALPAVIDNSTNQYFRGIFWQGGCSCGQASSEGYVFTYEIDRKRNLDASLDENRYAYSFTYNFLNIGNTVCGASFLESQDIIREAGIPNLPTNNNVMTDAGMKHWLNGYDKYYACMQNRINNVYAIHVGTPEGLDILKHWLNDHLEDSQYGGLAFFYANHVYDPDTVPLGTPEGGKHIITGFTNTSHAMTIVGYNDSVRFDFNHDGQYTNDIDITGDGIVDMRDWEIGALKIANTYNGGQSPLVWADQGFCYVAYRILPYHNSNGGIWDKTAYVSDVKPSYTPLLTAKVNMTYNSRDKIKVMVGVSTDLSSDFPEHIEEFPHFRFQGDALYMQGETDEQAKTIEFGLDISELLNYVQPGQQAKYFLYIVENDPQNVGEGSVNSFSVIDYTNGTTEYTSPQSNVQIVDNGNTLLSVNAGINYSNVTITNDTVPKAELNNTYHYQLEANGGTQPYQWFPFYNYKITTINNTFTPITGTVLSNTFNNVHLDFNFPFYGKKYRSGTVSARGALMFECEDSNVPYDRDYSVLFRYFKSIAPFYGDLSNATIKYEGDNTYAKLYWTANFDGHDLQFMITLFPDGKIYIDYGNNTTPDNPEWSAGITKGDQINYQEFDFSGNNCPSNTRIILEPRPFPEGLNLSKDGLLYGTLTQEFLGDSIFVKVFDNNWLYDIKGFLFTNKGLLISNHQVSTPNNNIIEYGETCSISLDLTNVGEPSINNINIELIDVDSNYVLVDSLDTLSTLTQNQTQTLNNAFTFTTSEHIHDNTLLTFVTHITSDEVSAADTFTFVARAPVIDIINTEIIDGNDNILDPGETADVIIHYKNTGGSPGYNLTASYSTADPYITINSVSNNTTLILEPDSTWLVTINITAAANTPSSYYSIIDSYIDGDRSFHSYNQFEIGIGLIVENWENGTGNSEFPWGYSGNANWFTQANYVYEGDSALQSGDINDNEISSLKIVANVTNTGNISFYSKVSSEQNYDYLRFYIDDQEVGAWSGNVDWLYHSYPVSIGEHIFEWKYEKDGSVSNGEDAAWVDFIVFPAIDFTPAQMHVSQSSIVKYMTTNQTDTDTLFIYNTGGSLLQYTSEIDNTNFSKSIKSQDKSIDGSYLTANPDSFYTGTPISVQFIIYNNSTDNEWVKNLNISFPLGVRLDSATNFTGGTGGDLAWQGGNGNGSDVTWYGEDDNGWGVLRNQETATATMYLMIDTAIHNSVIFQYEISGDEYGAEPHAITDFLVLNNAGINTNWISISNTSGNIISGDSAALLVNFNTYSIPVGTYTSSITITSNVDTIIVPVTLHVVDPTNIDKTNEDFISIFPNPAKNKIRITSNNTLGNIKIVNISGISVKNFTLNKNTTDINISDLNAGIYFIKSNKGVFKFVKE